MPEDPTITYPSEPNEDAIAKLRDEFSEQFAALKSSFEESNAEKDAQIAALKEENDSLHRALIRSAVTDPPEPPKEPTPEEIHNEQVRKLADRTLHYMQYR